MSKLARWTPSLLFLLFVGCQDQPTQPSDMLGDAGVEPELPAPRLSLDDGAHDGNPHFFFLPPLVPTPSHSGAPDGALSPRVEVCEFTASNGCLALISEFTPNAGTGSEVVRYDAAAEQYVVNWKTDQCLTGACTLSSAKTYRIRVLVGAAELGFADVKVYASQQEAKNTATGEEIQLLNGRTLPIKFRVEQGAVAVVPPGEPVTVGASGGEITTADGQVAIEVPAGAVQSSTPITVEEAATYPAGTEGLAPVYELGPDGTTFIEPVTLSLLFDPDSLPPGVALSELALYTATNGSWELVPGSTVNLVANTVSAEISHFSAYTVLVRPNTISGSPTSTQLAIGQTTVATGYVVQQVTKVDSVCYIRRTFPTSRRICNYYPSTFTYPIPNQYVYWSSSNASVATVPPGPTVTDQSGGTESPAITAKAFGSSSILAYVSGLNVTSSPLQVSVLPRLSWVPGSIRISRWQSGGFNLHSEVTVAAALPVLIAHGNPTVTTFTENLNIPAGNSRTNGVAYALAEGEDTITASAAGHLPAQAVVRVGGLGGIEVDSWPSFPRVGDSVALNLRLLSPDGVCCVGLALNLTEEFVLSSSGGITFSDGTQPIASVIMGAANPGGGRFYMKAVSAGETSITISNSHYVAFTRSLNISPPPDTWTAADAALFHTCGVLAGVGYCWGNNFYTPAAFGELGIGSTSHASRPTATVGGRPFASIKGGYVHTCGITTGGEAFCWGWNVHGQVGDGSTTTRTSPAAVATTRRFDAIGAGTVHSCGKVSSGEVFCWGNNSFGSLGDGTTTARLTPTPVSLPHPLVSLTVGGFHSCGLTSTGEAWCWGRNSFGQIGNGSLTDALLPVPVSGSHRFRQLAAGSTNVCGVDLGGSVWCWGNGSSGQLGNGANAQSSVPVRVQSSQSFQSVSPGKEHEGGVEHICAVGTDGKVWCWGANNHGQLGNGTTTGSNVPVESQASLTFSSVTSGGFYTCAVTSDQSDLYCWGRNEYGQLGTLTGSVTRPTRVVRP